MNNFTKEIIDSYANKLLFNLSEEESSELLKEFADIEKRMDLINKIPNINNVEPMAHPFPLENILLREDVATESLPIDLAFRNSGKVTDGEVEVPRVVA